MRTFAFFFLMSVTLGVTLPLPALAAQDSKELSEEEEIALMMEQLEQFKASWESQDPAPEMPKPKVTQTPKTETKPESKPVRIDTPPQPPLQQAKPSIKITTPQVIASGPVQIKTQDGRILSGGVGSVAAEMKPGIKTTPATAQPVVKLPAALQKPLEKQTGTQAVEKPAELPMQKAPGAELKKPTESIEPVKSAMKTVPVTPQKKPELPVAKADSKPIDQDFIKKLNIPSSSKRVVSSEVSKLAPQAAPTAETALKAAEVIPKEALVDSLPAIAPPATPLKVVEQVKAPQQPQRVVPPEPSAEAKNLVEPKMMEAPVKKGVVPDTAVKSAKGDSSVTKVEPVEDEIVIVQDDAAAYRAAREDVVTPLSAREAVLTRGARRLAAQSSVPGPEIRVIDGDDAKTLGRKEGVSLPGDPRSKTRSKWVAAQRKGEVVKKGPPKPNLFADTFYLTSEQRLAYDVYDIDGFIFVKSPNPDLNTKYAVVTGFGGGAMKTRSIPNLQTLEEAKKWVSDNLESKEFEKVEIKRMKLGKDEGAKELYWVGQKAYPDFNAAQRAVAGVQSVVALQGGDFAQLVSEAATYAPMTDGTQGVEIKGPANFEREEELMLKYMDQLDIGNKLFGPFQGDPSGESFTWQSFGETTWRRTNLDRTDYRSQVGYWTNRVVFKGIRFPLNTVEPFLESTISMDSTSADFSSNMKLFAGLEWRPFARNPWLYNYRPWGGINVLEWIKNFRFYVMYGERKAIKDPIEGSADTDLLAGVQIFYEWGVELPPLDQAEPKTFSDFVERYFWGEYFGDYRHEMTNFGSEDDYNSWLGNSSITMGVKLPGIPLPDNPITEELMLMPYMRFEHVNSAEFSFPYQNQYFVAAGMRWMPWRNYRYKENEWLSKAKFFGEYVGVGLSQHAKQNEEAPYAVRWDLRFGVSFSSRRY